MWQTLGYPRVTEALSRALQESGPSHAYLMVGPAQVGKRRLALDLAKAANCADPANAPCDACSSCDRIERGVNVDVEWTGIAEEDGRRRKQVGLAQIQQLQHQANLAPFEGRYRVLIIDPANLMTREAANCLLKTLEEPPASVILILIAATDALLLPTIQSRCQRIGLRPLPSAEVSDALEDRSVLAAEQREFITRRARGRLGWAMAAATDESFRQVQIALVEEAAGLVYLPATDRLQLVSRLAGEFSKDRQLVLNRLGNWLEWWRDVLLVALGSGDLAVSHDRLDELTRQADAFGLSAVRRVIRALETAIQQLNDNASARLVLDVLLLQIPASNQPGPLPGRWVSSGVATEPIGTDA